MLVAVQNWVDPGGPLDDQVLLVVQQGTQVSGDPTVSRAGGQVGLAGR